MQGSEAVATRYRVDSVFLASCHGVLVEGRVAQRVRLVCVLAIGLLTDVTHVDGAYQAQVGRWVVRVLLLGCTRKSTAGHLLHQMLLQESLVEGGQIRAGHVADTTAGQPVSLQESHGQHRRDLVRSGERRIRLCRYTFLVLLRNLGDCEGSVW